MPGFFTKPDIRKPNGPTARARARKKRKDAAVADRIRELVFARDGTCRYGSDVLPAERTTCTGRVHWAHFGEMKRFKTRGMAPEKRHSMAGSLCLCHRHHAAYDAGSLKITAQDPDRGCDGLLAYRETRDTVKESSDE